MRKSVKRALGILFLSNIFKIMLFAGVIIIGGILKVYLDNAFSVIVLYIGCFGLLGYALLFTLGGIFNMILEEIELYKVKKIKKKK